MKRKGVSYDVGRVMGGNWRPVFDPKIVHRELAIIKNDLHCNAVRICGLDIGRLMTAAEDALKLGLEVWLSPEMWDKSQDQTLAHIAKAATSAEKLREQWPDTLVATVSAFLTVGSSLRVSRMNARPTVRKSLTVATSSAAFRPPID